MSTTIKWAPVAGVPATVGRPERGPRNMTRVRQERRVRVATLAMAAATGVAMWAMVAFGLGALIKGFLWLFALILVGA